MDTTSHHSVVIPRTLTQLSKIFMVYLDHTGLEVNFGLACVLIVLVYALLG